MTEFINEYLTKDKNVSFEEAIELIQDQTFRGSLDRNNDECRISLLEKMMRFLTPLIVPENKKLEFLQAIDYGWEDPESYRKRKEEEND